MAANIGGYTLGPHRSSCRKLGILSSHPYPGSRCRAGPVFSSAGSCALAQPYAKGRLSSFPFLCKGAANARCPCLHGARLASERKRISSERHLRSQPRSADFPRLSIAGLAGCRLMRRNVRPLVRAFSACLKRTGAAPPRKGVFGAGAALAWWRGPACFEEFDAYSSSATEYGATAPSG